MNTVTKTEAFSNWLTGLKDVQAQARIVRRIEHVQAGNFGDHKSVGDGVSELRFTFGPGYRVYFVKRGSEIVVLIGGGTKRTQKRDIAAAKTLAKEI